MRSSLPSRICFALTLAGAAAPAAEDTSATTADAVWIEGEHADRKDVTRHNWYDDVKKDTLSGNDWLSHFNPDKVGTAEFDFDVVTADRYTFWIRANPIQARLSYRLDRRGEWQRIDLSQDQRGTANIATDNKPDLRFITWVKAGTVDLAAGKHVIAFRMDSGPQNHGAIDCFTFVRVPFVPSGTRKPALSAGSAAPDEWFPVVMDTDPLSAESVIDMSRLIEVPAGGHGFLQRDGDALRFERGAAPVKFWAVNAQPQGRSAEEMTHAARWFRKHGINLVRQHTVIDAVGLLDAQGRFNADRLDRYDRWFAALKAEGLYTTWSVVYPHHGAFLQRHDVDAGLFAELDAADGERDGRRGPIVVNDFLNLDRRLQDVAWKYFAALLDHVNPHTGLAYKDDPALACLEFQNESNVFFFTLNVLSEPGKVPTLARQMRRRFFEFAQEKYGSQAAASRAWGGLTQRGDDWDRGELALMGAHHWGSDGPLYEYAGQTRRAGDYIEFLTALQKEYFDRRQQDVRAAGFKGVTVATAWRSGGPAASMADLFTDTAADVIDRHNYFGGGDGGHRITEGRVDNDTHLSQPGHGLLNLGLFQVHDRPFAVSEWTQMPPNPWKAEAAPLYAFYGMGLQGWDAVYHFALGSGRMGDGWPDQGKYVTHTPHYLGQFPALAFAVHHGHLREGDVVALRRVSRDDLFAGRDVLGQSLSGGGFDSKELEGSLTTPPSALAVGRVTIEFADGEDRRTDLDQNHDERSQTLISTTGELVWRYGDRIVEVRSPKTQAVIGFAGGRTIQLPGATVSVDTPFVSLLLTPLDNLNLAESRRILITAMARDKQTGSEFNEDWSRLISMGGPPLLMEPVQATLRFAGERPQSVRPLDLYGAPKSDSIALSADGSVRIDGRFQTYYYEVRR
jgi:hypothetical protein